MRLPKQLAPYDPAEVEKLLARFQITQSDLDKEERWAWFIKKSLEGDLEITRLREEIARLKTRVNGLLNKKVPK